MMEGESYRTEEPDALEEKKNLCVLHQSQAAPANATRSTAPI